MNDYDLIVVGLGAMGAATLFHASRQGLRVLGIDRHDPPHEFGSSHAETRLTRLAVGEGPQYLPFVARSHEIWRALEAETGRALLHLSGGCIITPLTGTEEERRWGDFVTATARVAEAGGIDFRLLEPDQLRQEHPAILIRDHERAGIEPTGGVVMAERAVELQLQLAKADGAQVQVNETVTALDPDDDGVTVTTTIGNYRAEKVVLATGPWMPELAAPQDASQLIVTRQVVYWFEVEDVAAFSTDRFPTIIWTADSIEHYLGVFPIPPGGTPALKVVGEQFTDVTDAASANRGVSQTEIQDFYRRVVAPRLEGVTNNCVRATACLYTNTPDDHFFIDTDPRSNRVIAMSPCSGHGFKHSTALGQAVAQLAAAGSSDLNLTPFKRRW